MVDYNKVVEEIRFLELRQNTHTEAMESELWRNGFYVETWSFFREASDSVKFKEEPFEINFQELIEKYGAVKGILLRNEFVMPNAVLKYKILIEKGEELSLEINEYLAS